MTDTKLRAPLAGTIIAKNVELGTVISSPTTDVGGGTVLFKMANLDTVQIRALVDETDIGKVQAGLLTTITVDAYPNRPFEGAVLKVEPQATVQQNVTMFNVLVRIPNPNHLLKPGMNTEVEIHVGRRDSVLAIPNAALRTQRDVASAAQVLGLDPNAVQQQLAAAQPQTPPSTGRDSASLGGSPSRRDSTAQKGGAAQVMMTLPNGQQVPAPAGITAQQVRLAQSAMQKRMSGGTPSDEEQTAARAVFQAMRASGQFSGMGGGQGRRTGGEPSSYIVFVLRKGQPAPVQIRTGLTDLDYIEVVSGLTEQDTVLVLPSASLVNSQRDMQQRMRQFTGGGLPGVQQQQTPARPPAAAPARP
jgi:HlyD family secretion protein